MSFLPGISEMQMSKLTFAEQIKHPEWQKRRLHMLEAADWECTHCGSKEASLNVHHRRYVKGRLYWEYSDEELQVLCQDCHEKEHANIELMHRLLTASASEVGFGVASVAALLAGYLYGLCSLDPELHEAAIGLDGTSFDLGVLVSLASCASWKSMGEAADILAGPALTPQQRNVIERWKAPPL